MSDDAIPAAIPASQAPAVMTSAEAAAFLRLGERTVMRLVADGAIPHTRIGRRVLFVQRRLLDWVEDRGRGSERVAVGAAEASGKPPDVGGPQPWHQRLEDT